MMVIYVGLRYEMIDVSKIAVKHGGGGHQEVQDFNVRNYHLKRRIRRYKYGFEQVLRMIMLDLICISDLGA